MTMTYTIARIRTRTVVAVPDSEGTALRKFIEEYIVFTPSADDEPDDDQDCDCGGLSVSYYSGCTKHDTIEHAESEGGADLVFAGTNGEFYGWRIFSPECNAAMS